MGDNFGLTSNTNLAFIEFDDQQKAHIGAALQAVADQILPKLDRQLLSNFKVDGGSSYVEDSKVESLITPASVDSTYVSSLSHNVKAEVKTEISNHLLLESSNDLTSYLTKEEPQLQEFEIDPPAPDDDTSAWSADIYCSKDIESMNMQYISDEGSALSTDCGNEALVGGESIDSIESDSQDDDSNQNFEEETKNINYNNFIRHICPECGVDCGPYSKWKLHTETQHSIAWHSFISETKDGESCYQCIECKKKLNKKSRFRLLQEHHIKHLPHSSYLQCHFCDKRFQALSYVLHHLKRKHAKIIGPYANNKHSHPNIRYIKIFCPICQESQLNIRLWQQHLTEKHDYENKIKSEVTQIDKNRYSCNLCQKKVRRDYIKTHMLSHLRNKSFHCTLCKKTDTCPRAAVAHVSRMHFCSNQNKLFECSFCKATFAKKSLLENHYQTFHKNEISNNTVIKDSPPRNHVETDGKPANSLNQLHSNQLQLRTSYDFSTDNTLTKQEPQEFEIEQPSPPDESEYLSYSNEIESINIQKNSNVQTGLIKNCNNEQDDKMIIHSIETNSKDEEDANQNIEQGTVSYDCWKFIHYICPECGEDCGPYSKWKLHTNTQHTIEWSKFLSKTEVDGKSCYKCLECNAKLSYKMSFTLLQEHHIKHMLHKDYLKCNSCDKKFKSRSAINSHIKRSHAKLSFKKTPSNTNIEYIKIFCPFCEQLQSDIKQWRQHLTEKHDFENKAKSQTTQINKFLYSCQLCPQKIRKDDLKDHMLTHESKKSFHCTLCKKYGTTLRAAIQHRDRKHSATQRKMICFN